MSSLSISEHQLSTKSLYQFLDFGFQCVDFLANNFAFMVYLIVEIDRFDQTHRAEHQSARLVAGPCVMIDYWRTARMRGESPRISLGRQHVMTAFRATAFGLGPNMRRRQAAPLPASMATP